jgi:hypothetical protein
MLVLAVAALVAAVGVFDAVTWNGGLFHSYVVNIAYNLVAGGLRAGESPPWQFLWWLALARGYRSASIRAPASSSSFSLVSKPVQDWAICPSELMK